LLRHLVASGEHEFYLSDLFAPLHETLLPHTAEPEVFRQSVRRLVARVPRLWRFVPLTLHDLINRRRLRQLRADIYFGTSYLGLFAPPTKTVVTIHDLCYAHYPQTASWRNRWLLRRRLQADARRADAIFAVSGATRRDVLDLLGVAEEKVHVIYEGVADEFRPITDEEGLAEVRARYGLASPFILFVGTVEPRKNLVRLIEAFRLLTNSPGLPHRLVIVGGKGWADKAIYQALDPLRRAGRAVLTGRAGQQDLPFIYNLADAFVLPSLCEGFGLPLIEAMACGTPVVTSNAFCMPEIADGAAVLVDPLSVASIADGIRRVVEDSQLREQLKRKGLARAKDFSWENAARKTLDVFERLAGV
jgi:glycosyltransferase involved in cell wall biosynthesis